MTTLTHPAAPTLSTMTRAELAKSVAAPGTAVAILAGVAATIALPLLVVLTGTALEPADLAMGSGMGLMVVMSAVAVLATSDIQHGTLHLTRWADPDRLRGYLGKVAVGGVLGVVAGLAAGLGLLSVGMLDGLDPAQGDVLRASLGQAAVFGPACALAAALGMLLRKGGLVVGAVILWIQVIETMAPQLPTIGEALREWLPFMNAFMFSIPGSFAEGSRDPYLALAYFGLVCVAGIAASAVAVVRRDS